MVMVLWVWVFDVVVNEEYVEVFSEHVGVPNWVICMLLMAIKTTLSLAQSIF